MSIQVVKILTSVLQMAGDKLNKLKDGHKWFLRHFLPTGNKYQTGLHFDAVTIRTTQTLSEE
jgi:hypothetical protein